MIDLFGDKEWRPLVKMGKVLPYYYVSREGQIYNTKSGRIRQLHPKPPDGYLTASLSIPNDLYDDYRYFSDGRVNTCLMSVQVHKVVAETWLPLDENPPEKLKDTWDQVPEEWRQWVKDTAIVDHIDSKVDNNHSDNLRWVTPKQNNYSRKKNELSCSSECSNS
jgi:hypothetical protein